MDNAMEKIDSGLPKQPSQEDILVTRAREDIAAFAGLYDLYVQPVYRYLLSKLGNVQDAEDQTGQTFLSAMQNFPRYRHKGNFAAWLFTIARNKAADFYRKKGSQQSFEEAEAALSSSLEDLTAIKTERQIDLAELIEALPEKDQELLRLRFVAQMQFKEIAALLGKNAGAVKKATYRLLEKLEIQLEDYRE